MKLFESIKMRVVVWVWNQTPHCDEMSRLASQALDQALPWKTRARMRLHFLICVWCKRYFQQLSVLRESACQSREHAGHVPGPTLSSEARERMKARLKQGPGPSAD